jgi:hypothetical protein
MQGMPQPTEHHKKLHKFAGSWVGDETLSPSPWGPGGPAIGRTTGRVECDGFFLIQEYVEEKDGKVVFRGHGVFGYDDKQHDYAWYWVDSMGGVPPAPSRGKWEGDTLIFESSGNGQRARFTYTFVGGDRYKFLMESSFDDGKTWKPFVTAEYKRVG